MARRSPLCMNSGQIEQIQFGDNFGNIVLRANGSGSTALGGNPVYAHSATDYRRALATSLTTSRVVGICITASAINGADMAIQCDGVVELSTTLWDAVTGQSGGLTAGANYFLGTSVGTLVLTPPSSATEVIVLVGRALSTTELRLILGPQVLL